MCAAFTTMALRPTSSNRLYSGFQYDAVLSIAIISQPLWTSQPHISLKLAVIVPN
jgi:hypothetical protein